MPGLWKGSGLTQIRAQTDTPRALPESGAVRRILVVDDSGAQRLFLSSALLRQGYDVTTAASGDEALTLCRDTPFDLVLSDWVMPGMSGLEFCQAFRSLPREDYGYFILLTSKSAKGAVAQGLDVGADDFLSKPVDTAELRARINAGDRLLRMQRELAEKNRMISANLAEISTLYDGLDRDLVEARKMQQSLVRETSRRFWSAEISLLLRPCGHVGGDLVGLFEAGQDRVGVFSIDVSGHGIASALLAARLAGYFSDSAPDQNIALVQDENGQYIGRPAAAVATLLNNLMTEDVGTEHYFTLLFGYIDLKTGQVEITQCGHPNPAILTSGGGLEYIGNGGLPIGLLPDAQYTQQTVQMNAGDRLLFYSDGFTECADDKGNLLDEAGFRTLVTSNAELTGGDFFEALVWDLDLFSGTRDFPDDLSCAVIGYNGPEVEK